MNSSAKPVARVAMLSVALGLSACASGMHWEHPESGQLNLSADMAQCARLAAAEAWRTEPLFPFRYRHGRHGFWWNDPLYEHDRFWREAELRDFCLKSRGYRLMPDAPTN
jgi:hypothetical protein